jgi:Co/Zn/Cd efflux system component
MTELRSPRRVVLTVALLNLAYFGIEFAVATAVGSVSLFADSVDFLEDASVNFLVLLALGLSSRKRAHVGMILAGVLLVPAIAALWMAWTRFNSLIPPDPQPLTITGLGALAVNFTCAWMLSRHRDHSGSLILAAFLSARNDVIASIAIIAAGLLTAYTASAWPDLIVGLGIAAMNISATRAVLRVAKSERHQTSFAGSGKAG